ncbi:Putative IS1328 transposase [Moritella viscosa]|nr:Putative IS1328 transposase [Moritella viscosa]
MKKLFDWLSQQSTRIPKLLLQELIDVHEYYVLLNERVKQQEKNYFT